MVRTSRVFVYDGLGSRFSCVIYTVHFENGIATEGYARLHGLVVPIRNVKGRWFMAYDHEVHEDTLNACSYARTASL